MKDIPDYSSIVAKSESFDEYQSYYPGAGPDGSGTPNEADGPVTMISPMQYAVDHLPLPKYLLDAVQEAMVQENGATLDDALIAELTELGYSQEEIAALMASSEVDNTNEIQPVEAVSKPAQQSSDGPASKTSQMQTPGR